MSLNSNFKSQYKQDQIVDILLNKKRDGFFLDIGAYDGVTFSNTYFFEKERSWDGICVEPISSVFCTLKKNRNCVLINGAISESEGEVSFVHVTGYAEMLSGIGKFRSEKHILRTEREILENGGKINHITCKSYSINKLLSKYNTKNVDYLSVDTEGGEFEILSSIDFTQYHFKIITVENNYKDEKLRHYMEDNGFFYLFTCESDDYYSSNRLRGFRLLVKNEMLGRIFLKNILKSFTISNWVVKKTKNLKSLISTSRRTK